MDLGERRGLVAIGAAVGAVILIVVLVGVASPGNRSPAASRHPASATDQSVTSTTAGLKPVPGGPATTARPAPVVVPTTRPPATTTTVAPPTRVGAQYAYLRPPPYTAVRVADPSNCAAQADGPQWSTSCGVAQSAAGDLMWVIESRALSGGTAWHVYALRHQQGDQWVVAVDVADDSGLQGWSEVNAAAVDVTGDGSQDLVFGFHGPGASQPLVVEVVSGLGRVNLHRLYTPDGAVTFVPGQLDGWWLDATGAPFHEVLRYLSGAWRVVAQTSADGVHPPSAV